MSGQRMGVVLWSALVLAAMALIVLGLERSLLWVSTPQLRQQARIGHLLIYAGSAVLIAAALWSYLRRQLLLSSMLVAAPAFLLAGLVLATPYSLFPHIAALFALPATVLGLILGIRDSRNRRHD